MEVNDIVQVRFYNVLGDQAAVNVRHYKVTAKAGTGATLSDWAAHLAGAGIPAAYKALLVGEAAYMGLDVQVIRPVLGIPVRNQTGQGSGDNSGDPLPGQVSGLIKLVTALGGRKYRGRMYIPFPYEGDNTSEAKPSLTYKEALDDLATLMDNTYVGVGAGGNTNTFEPCIYHRGTATSTPVVSASGSAKWATQRRRGNYGRPNSTPF